MLNDRAEEKKKQEMLHQFEEEEHHVQEVFQMRKRELDLQNEKKKLNVQLKQDNVERVKRMGEYKRFNILKKIEDTDKFVPVLL
jgi:protein subunit release factor B